MKKAFAVLISMLMIFSVAAIPPVMAEGLLTGTYTFIDTCYSPEKGIYMAVAKDLSNGNTPAKIFTSTNGEDWKDAKTFAAGIHYASKENRQTVVWWEAEQKFIAVMNDKTYTSEDGETWKAAGNAAYHGSNTIVETNGKVLALCSGKTVKILQNLTDDPAIFSLVDQNAYGKTIGLTADEPYTYSVTDQWKTWQFDSEGNLHTATPDLGAHPFDMAYAKALNGWIVINGTPVLRVLDQGGVTYTNFSSMKLSDGKTNEDKFTAGTANDDNIALGTDKGGIYVAPSDKASLTVDTAWAIAQPGAGTEPNTEMIRSISAVDDGMFLAVSKSKIYMVMQSGDGWAYYDTSKSRIVLEGTRIEIPESGTLTQTLAPIHYNFKGEISDDAITSFEAISALPAGVTVSSTGSASAELSVASTTAGGHEITFRAATAKGKTQDFIVTIVDEDYIEIRGVDEMAVPNAGEAAEHYPFEAVIVGTDGQDMARETVLEMISMPEGVQYNEENHTFTIDDSVQAGTIILKAHSSCNPDNETEKRITVSLRTPNKVTFSGGDDSLFIPDELSQPFQYSATLFDQTNKEMPDEKLVWSVSAQEIESMDGIAIDQETGILTVSNAAVSGVVTVTAASASKPEVSAQKNVTLQYTDLRMAKEDLAEFVIDTKAPVTGNLNLITTGTYASTISWRSSDETLIKPDGTVIRPSREDKKATITGVSKKNTASTEKKFELTVKKADNLSVNGDLSRGTTDGWEAKTESSLAIIQENGKNVLQVLGKGAYQTFQFTNDSSFAFEAKVKAASGSKIRLVSQAGGTIAELTASGGYQDIKGSYDYRRQNHSFEDKIFVESDNGLFIDQMKVYEITLELNVVTAAVNKAVYSKKTSDKNYALTLLGTFYDLPIRAELYDQLNKIADGSGGGGGGNSGGGGSRPSGSIPSGTGGNGNQIATPVKQEDNYQDELDTYILRFKDMKNHWAREDVEYMGSLEIVSGNEENQFLPDNKITRAEFAALITRTMGLSETEYENSFFDVVSEDWYSGYVQTVRSNQFMNGYDGLFNPNDLITREEIAKVIVAAYNNKTKTKLETGKALYFRDLADISYWAYDYIAEAVELGFTSGVTDELFAPKEPATRAQAVVMLKRVYDKLNPAD